MTPTYHLWLDEAAKGPFTLNQLRAMWNQGQLTTETSYSANAGVEWRSLAELIPELEPQENSNKSATIEDNSEYQFQLNAYLQRGWSVITEGPSGAQIQAKKKMAGLTIVCLTLGVVLIALYGIGLLLIICALIGHAIEKPETKFIARNCTEKDRPIFLKTYKKKTRLEFLLTILLIVGLIGGLILLIWGYAEVI